MQAVMEHGMSKKTLDLLGGAGSILAAIGCVYFVMQHPVHDSMWKVWVGMMAVLLINGVLMILNAQRLRRKE